MLQLSARPQAAVCVCVLMQSHANTCREQQHVKIQLPSSCLSLLYRPTLYVAYVKKAYRVVNAHFDGKALLNSKQRAARTLWQALLLLLVIQLHMCRKTIDCHRSVRVQVFSLFRWKRQYKKQHSKLFSKTPNALCFQTSSQNAIKVCSFHLKHRT